MEIKKISLLLILFYLNINLVFMQNFDENINDTDNVIEENIEEYYEEDIESNNEIIEIINSYEDINKEKKSRIKKFLIANKNISIVTAIAISILTFLGISFLTCNVQQNNNKKKLNNSNLNLVFGSRNLGLSEISGEYDLCNHAYVQVKKRKRRRIIIDILAFLEACAFLSR